MLGHELAVLRRQISLHGWISLTASSLPRPASCAAAGHARSSSVRTPCWVGIASSCASDGRMRGAAGQARSLGGVRELVLRLARENPRGAPGGSSVSSPASVSASRQRRSPRSCGKPAFPRPVLVPSSVGALLAYPRRLDHRLRLLHGRHAVARTPPCALLPRTPQPACPFRRLHREPRRTLDDCCLGVDAGRSGPGDQSPPSDERGAGRASARITPAFTEAGARPPHGARCPSAVARRGLRPVELSVGGRSLRSSLGARRQPLTLWAVPAAIARRAHRALSAQQLRRLRVGSIGLRGAALLDRPQWRLTLSVGSRADDGGTPS